MKKGMSKLLSALLIATLVFTSAGVAFADTGGSEGLVKAQASKTSTKEISKQISKTEIVEPKTIKSLKKAAATPKTTVGYINVTNLVTGEESIEEAVVPAKQYSNSKYGFSQAYTAPAKGTLQILGGAEESSVSYGLFYDPDMTNPVDSTGYASAKAVTDRTFKVPSAGTYYIGIYASSNVSAFGIAAVYANGADRTITAGKRITVGQKDAQTNYFKFKATQTGYLQVVSSDYGKVTLCKSNKKALSNATSTYYAPTYGVKKGTTYYIKLASDYNYDGYYQFQVTNKKITEKSGKKKSKAVTIKKKKTKKGTIIAGSSQADWYKFKLGGKKKVTLTMKGATNNKLKVVVYNKKGKKVSSAYNYNYYSNKLTLKSYGKLPKGTYYIKVYRGTKTSSGWYSLSWK